MTRAAEGTDKVEHVAKVLFDHMRYVYNIHECGWPGWASECDKADYRKLAQWHLTKVKAEHKRAVRVVKAEIKRVKLDQHSYKGYEKTIALALLGKLLAALQKGRT